MALPFITNVSGISLLAQRRVTAILCAGCVLSRLLKKYLRPFGLRLQAVPASHAQALTGTGRFSVSCLTL